MQRNIKAPAIEIKNLTKVFGNGDRAFNDFSLTLNAGETLVLSGETGSGKTTLLRIIAGLEIFSGGTLFLHGADAQGMSVPDRDIAMVFESSGLFDKFTVRGNLAYGLSLRNTAKDVLDLRVKSAAELFELSALLDSKLRSLSPLQNRIVQLARCYAREPGIILIDEPVRGLENEKTELVNAIKLLRKNSCAAILIACPDAEVAAALDYPVVTMPNQFDY